MRRFAVLAGIAVIVSICLSTLCVAQDQTNATPASGEQPTAAVATTGAASSSSGGGSSHKFDFVLNVLPASILINVDSDKFNVTQPDTGKKTLSAVYLMPNLSAGVGTELGSFYVDATAGLGLVVNESFRTFLVEAMISANYAATDSLKFGPHLGLIYFTNPEWVDNSDVTFDGTWGYLAGLQLSMGDRITYLVSVDLIAASFDAESASPQVGIDSEELRLTGLAVQFGVRGEF